MDSPSSPRPHPVGIALTAIALIAVVLLLLFSDTDAGPNDTPTRAPEDEREVAVRAAAEAPDAPDSVAREVVDASAPPEPVTVLVDAPATEDPLATVQLIGIVVDGSEQPVAGARVALFDMDSRFISRWYELTEFEEVEEEIEEVEWIEDAIEIEEEEDLSEIDSAEVVRTEPAIADEPIWLETESDTSGRFELTIPAGILGRPDKLDPVLVARADGFLESGLERLTSLGYQVLRLEHPARVELPVRLPAGIALGRYAALQVHLNGNMVIGSAVEWALREGDTAVFDDLDPGSYELLLVAGCGRWESARYAFDLLPGETRVLDELDVGAAIARHALELVDANGRAVINTEVEVRPPVEGPQVCTNLRTDALGQVAFDAPAQLAGWVIAAQGYEPALLPEAAGKRLNEGQANAPFKVHLVRSE